MPGVTTPMPSRRWSSATGGHAEAQARRHYRRGEPIDDLTQVAYEALLLALQALRS